MYRKFTFFPFFHSVLTSSLPCLLVAKQKFTYFSLRFFSLFFRIYIHGIRHFPFFFTSISLYIYEYCTVFLLFMLSSLGLICKNENISLDIAPRFYAFHFVFFSTIEFVPLLVCRMQRQTVGICIHSNNIILVIFGCWVSTALIRLCV